MVAVHSRFPIYGDPLYFPERACVTAGFSPAPCRVFLWCLHPWHNLFAESLHPSDREPADLVHESHRPTHRKTQDWQPCVMGDAQHKGK